MTPTTGDFLQIHVLTSYPAALLNRDDVGLAKRLPFGDAVRIRVSSQCLKKHWRDAIRDKQDQITGAIRSRCIFDHFIAKPLQEAGVPATAAYQVANKLANAVLQQKKETSQVGADEESGGQADAGKADTGQVLVLSQAEVDFLANLARKLVSEAKDAGITFGDAKALDRWLSGKELKTFLKEHPQLGALPASFDTAMFGRFITSDVLARVDSAVSVGHAFTTHPEQAETDYFTAIDMLGEDSGAGLLSDTELTAGVFYVYVVVDINKLRSNLQGMEDLTLPLIQWLVQAITTVSPGAKRGSTAPYAYAEFLLLERGNSQPRALANAFRRAVAVRGEADRDLMGASIHRLLAHREDLTKMYGDWATPTRSAVATVHRSAVAGIPVLTLPEAMGQMLT